MLDFTYTVQGLDVSCRILTKVPAGATPVWDFGDNKELDSPITGLNPTYTYESSGFYTISLLLEDKVNRPCIEKTVVLSEHVNTHLPGSIYRLIDRYLPREFNLRMSSQDKDLFINKWQLYIQPLVNHEIPVDKYNDELYYEGLENQLIMELAVYDFIYSRLTALLGGTAGSLEKYITGNSGPVPGDGEGGQRIKQITTGPTEVQYYDEITDSLGALYKAYTQASQKGGWLDQFRANICMLASRLDIYIPLCDQQIEVVVPKVVNHRNPGILGGPNPPSLVHRSGHSLIHK